MGGIITSIVEVFPAAHVFPAVDDAAEQLGSLLGGRAGRVGITTTEVDTGTGNQQLTLEDFRLSGPAKRFYDAESRQLLGLDANSRVTVEPFYTVGRDISVEPTTGTIVDMRENIKLFFAAAINPNLCAFVHCPQHRKRCHAAANAGHEYFLPGADFSMGHQCAPGS